MNREPLPNMKLSHYRIVSKIGAGGMVEVYLAEDERLRRRVALKVLPDALAQDTERVRRFEHEAFAASALNHPNIITVYDIGESEAGRFIMMELVAGRTLRDVIATDFSIANVLALGQHMAKALSAAHAAGITHRDIKPDNIMVRNDGYVKVLDFGLARLLSTNSGNSEAATLAQQTTPGTIMGTVAYMSPEQARGEGVSPPSDIFALGIVLYELATGRHPFQAETLVGYLHAITLQDPASLTQWKPELPTALNALILQMLNKEAGQRPTASEVAQTLLDIERRGDKARLPSGEGMRDSPVVEPVEAQTMILLQPAAAVPEALVPAAASAQPTTLGKRKLQSWWIAALLSLVTLAGGFLAYRSFASGEQAIDSLAVLPFQSRSGNADSEYLSDGLAETLIYRLSQLPNLKVSPTSSVFRYKGKDSDPVKVGSDLGVHAVMTGRIVQRGESLVISVELIDVRHNKTLWGEQYDRKLADLLAIQREMAAEITARLQLKLSGEGAQKLTKKYTDNNEAYQLYLRGRYHWNKRDINEFEKAVRYFKQAIEKDPNYALAYTGLADTYALFPLYGNFRPNDYYPQAKLAALKAHELDDNLAETHSSLGRILLYADFDFVGGEREFRRAIELDPKYATAHHWLGELLTFQVRHDESIQELKKALELDPFSKTINLILADYLVCAKRYDEALTQYKKTKETFPDDKNVSLYFFYAVQGKYPEAIESWLDFAKRNEFPKDLMEKRKAAYEKNGWEGFQ